MDSDAQHTLFDARHTNASHSTNPEKRLSHRADDLVKDADVVAILVTTEPHRRYGGGWHMMSSAVQLAHHLQVGLLRQAALSDH